MAASDNIGVNNIPFFEKFRLPSFSNLILRLIIIERELVFYSKYIDWDGANKWGYENHFIRG